MPFAALISATRDAHEPGVPLRATFWLAGRTLIERQALLAAEAGAQRIIILIERCPAELLAAIDRLRSAGLEVVTARSAAEAAAAVPAGVRLLMIADGFVGDAGHFDLLLSDDRPRLLAVGDRGFDERFERVDGATRWAGLALIDGDLLRDAAMMSSEWDVVSTLLRRAIQTGVKSLVLDGGRDANALAIVERHEDFSELQRRILTGAEPVAVSWVTRTVLAPVERAGAAAIMTVPLTPAIIGGTAAGLGGLAATAFMLDWRWLGLTLLLAVAPTQGIAERLAQIRLQVTGRAAWWRLLAPITGAAALLALGHLLGRTHGWGLTLLAAVTVAFLVALARESRGRRVAGAPFLADAASLPVLMLPFSAIGYWAMGLAAMFGYAAASFFWAQHQVHRRED